MNVAAVASILGPTSEGSEPRAVKVLSGTGTTEDVNDTVLPRSHFVTLKNHTDVPIKFIGRSVSGVSNAVDAVYSVLGPYDEMGWEVEEQTQWVYVEAYDGTSDYEASLWVSSPRGVMSVRCSRPRAASRPLSRTSFRGPGSVGADR